MNQAEIISGLPGHLQSYVEVQDYDAYSPRDHALWRFLMGRLVHQLSDTAHGVYREGLEKVGIEMETIPNLEVMNAQLKPIGWQVLGVSGFIPPAIFMEFQSRCILPIALRMRTIEQIFYTPAPDILHESAGHAPFLIDVDYSEFLQQFGKLGMKALSSEEDEALYQAVRRISDVKAEGMTGEDAVQQLEAAIADVKKQQPSEAAKLARLHWWTIEYGLVGTVDDYKLFGAGLLSSLGESASCLDDAKVNKRLLTVNAINHDYDITHEQPQLFVTHSCRHMRQVLDEMARGMCQFSGGADAVRQAITCRTVCTVQYASGIQISGVVSEVLYDAMDNPIYVRTLGPTQLAWLGDQLPGHGVDYHSSGFGSPVGKVNEMARCLSEYSIDELGAYGIGVGDEFAQPVTLEFVSGVLVKGRLIGIERRDQKNVLFSFVDCSVHDSEGVVLFDPDWGQYDMAVGHELVSVFGGAADRSSFSEWHSVQGNEYPTKIRLPDQAAGSGNDAAIRQDLYQASKVVREAIGNNAAHGNAEFESAVEEALVAEDWLLLLEVCEAAMLLQLDSVPRVERELFRLLGSDHDLKLLVHEVIATFSLDQ